MISRDSSFKVVYETKIDKWKPIYKQVLARNNLYFEDERVIKDKADNA